MQQAQKPNDVYRLLANTPFTDYITTNYDHSFELTLKEEGYVEGKGNMSEKTYSIRRHRTFHKGSISKRIWHIHGDLERPRSFMLGYDHYCGGLAKINEYVKGNYKSSEGLSHKINKIEERFKEGQHFQDIKSWIDLFFLYDVHFIGYGLDLSEIDIWWLLNRRIRMFKEQKMHITNSIFFHSTGKKKKDKETVERYHLLNAFKIRNIKQHPKQNDYASAYTEILNRIVDRK